MNREENISFEERWWDLLKESNEKLHSLSTTEDKDSQIRNLWTALNKYVSIMAIPIGVLSPMRKTLWQMARRSSWRQAGLILLYLLFTFLPRHTYRNTDTQRWFKKRLGIQ